jgi:hypothetical protein
MLRIPDSARDAPLVQDLPAAIALRERTYATTRGRVREYVLVGLGWAIKALLLLELVELGTAKVVLLAC